jgi:hypothetical protein
MTANTVTKKLYNNEIEIVFYPGSHRYKRVGEKDWLISATSALGVLDKSRTLIPWAARMAASHVRIFLEETSGPYSREQLLPVIAEAEWAHKTKSEKATDIGTAVHAWAEAFALAKTKGLPAPEVDKNADPRVLNGINAFLDWQKCVTAFLETENIVYSKARNYVGIFDLYADVGGQRALIDYKTSTGIYEEALYQLAGYWQAKEEEMGECIDVAIVVRFDKETGLVQTREMFREEYEDRVRIFNAALELKKVLKEVEAAKW